MEWWIVFLMLSVTSAEEICRSVERDPYLLFGTKTAYIFSNKGVPNLRVHEVLGCQPIAVWHLNRHGSHNPEAHEIPRLQQLSNLKNSIRANPKSSNQRICTSDLNILDAWQWNPHQNLSFAGDLTSDGYLTTQQLAQAFRQRFPGVLTGNRHDYMFKFVDDKISSTSFKAYTEGIFRAQAESYDIPKNNDEKLLKPYKHCPAWTKEVEENNDTLSQRAIFESKQEYKEMITNISLRLGFNYDIDKSSILSMYDMCRYNKAWNVQAVSPWCVAFTEEDLKRLEYAEDLEKYYKYGYGSPNSQKIGCTFVKDMMEFFSRHITADTPQQPKVTVHFTDAQMMLMTLTALGARRDLSPLTGDNYHANHVQARRWTTSTMSPFNGNLGAALYKCTPNGNFQIKDQYQVLFLENELPMNIEGCRVGLCDFQLIQSKFRETIEQCDLKFCNSAVKINGIVSLSLAAFSLLFRYLAL